MTSPPDNQPAQHPIASSPSRLDVPADTFHPDAARPHLRHNLRCSVIDGSFYMIMAGLAETFFPLFILALFADKVASGLILTVPIFLASVLQLASPGLVRSAGSYRRVVAWTAWLQAGACLPLALIAFTGFGPLWLVFLIATLYHTGAIVGGAPWSSMMSVLIPAHVRARFFARRNRLLQFGAVAGVLVGAAVLEWSSLAVAALGRVLDAASPLLGGLQLPALWLEKPALPAFGVLFLVAGLARAVSAHFLTKHIEPPGAVRVMKLLSLSELARRAWSGPAAGLVALLCAFQCAMMVGSPFWHAYAREIAFVSFLEWAGLVVVWMLGKALAVTWAGERARSRGRRDLFIVGALLVVPVPALWALSTNLVWMAIAQLLAGMAIACWELGVWLTTLETFSDEERTSMLSKLGTLQWLCGSAGSYAGGSLLRFWGNDRDAFIGAFLASTALRGAVALLIARRRT